MKLLVLALVTLLSALAGTVGSGTSGSVEARSNILWRDCEGGVQCGRMKVPLDHRRPSLDQIELAIARLPALDEKNRIGVILINPGGPGGSGIGLLGAASAIFPLEILERFDIIGFDPRGVGESTQIDCVDNLAPIFDQLDPSPDTPLELQRMIDAATEFGADCQRRSRALIQHVDTESVARDMDLIRDALGEEQISYLGYSYGTFIGAYYADLFPERVRAFVLDGALDPSLTSDEIVVQGAVGFERALDAFFADCAARAGCGFHLPRGGDLEAVYDALVARLDAEPLTDGPIPLTGDMIIAATRGLMYSPGIGWPVLGEALRQAQDGSSSGFLAALGAIPAPRPPGVPKPTPDELTNPEESFLAIACADLVTYTSISQWERIRGEAIAAAPHFGAPDTTFEALPCSVWPRVERRTPIALAAEGAPPILVVGTTNDPATPYAWSQRMAENLASGVLLTYHGEGHTAYSGNSGCIDDAVDAYLLDLRAPASGTVCEPDGPIATYPAPEVIIPDDSGLVPPPEPTPEPTRVGIAPPDTGSPAARARGNTIGATVAIAGLLAAGGALVLAARAAKRYGCS